MLRRSQADSYLHNELSKFMRAQNFKSGAHVAARLASYKEVNKLFPLAKQSTVNLTLGASSICFARFYTSAKLIELVPHTSGSYTLDEKLKNDFAAKFKICTSFEEIVQTTVQDSTAFFALEKIVHGKVERGDWQSKFTAFNRDTELYTKASIEPDLATLTTLRDRIWHTLA